MSGFRIEGSSGTAVDSNASGQIKVVPETDAEANPQNVGSIRMFSENDAGALTGVPYLYSAETDEDYRLRASMDSHLDGEIFNYAAQNTGKHTYLSSTLTTTWTVAGLTTNGSGVTTTGTGTTMGTYAEFPLLEATSLFAEFEVAFTNQPVSNAIIDFGLFRRGAATAYAPTDGAYFRLNSAGLYGILNYNGSETASGLINKTYTTNTKMQYIITMTHRSVQFWINNELAAEIETPIGQALPVLSATLPLSIRQAHTGVAGGVIQAIVGAYSVTIGGPNLSRNLGELGNAIFGSYQGLSGGTMGSLASFANSANPTAAVPTNTTSTVLTGLGGQGWETDTLAVTTDGVIMSYQIPLGTTAIQGKRLKLNGVKISSFVQTALTGGGYNAVFSLAFGHTAVSLATAEATSTKAPRRIALGGYSVASGLVALTQLPDVALSLANPVYVNPGEFVAIAKKKVGTAPSAGVIAHNIMLDYSWE